MCVCLSLSLYMCVSFSLSVCVCDVSVTENYTKLRVIWDELESYRPDPKCSCVKKCLCDALEIVKQRKVQDQVM